MFYSQREATRKAERLAKKTGLTYYVIRECGGYEVANDEDLDTFFNGTHDNDILYCTKEN